MLNRSRRCFTVKQRLTGRSICTCLFGSVSSGASLIICVCCKPTQWRVPQRLTDLLAGSRGVVLFERINLCTSGREESKPSCCNRGCLWTRALGFHVGLSSFPLPSTPLPPSPSPSPSPSSSLPHTPFIISFINLLHCVAMLCHPWPTSAYLSAKALWVVAGETFKGCFLKGEGGWGDGRGGGDLCLSLYS